MPVGPRSSAGRCRRARRARRVCSPSRRSGRSRSSSGDEVWRVGGGPGVVALAEALGAPVYGARCTRPAVFPPRTRCGPACWRRRQPASAPRSRRYERVLAVGGRAFMVYPYTDGSPLPDGTELVQLSPDPASLGRTYPVALGVAGDPAARSRRCCRSCGRGRRAAAADAVEAGRRERRQRDRRARGDRARRATARRRWTRWPRATPSCGRCRPTRAVVDEAITTGVYVRGFHHWTEPGRYFFCKGGGLGWGMPAALGVSLASRPSSARALRRRRRLGDVLAAGAVDRRPRAAAGGVRGREQPPVPDPQEQPAGHEGRQRAPRAATWPWTSSIRRSTSSAWRVARCGVVPAGRPRRRRRRRRPLLHSAPGVPTSSSCPSPHRDLTGEVVLAPARRAASCADGKVAPRRHRLGGATPASAGSCSAATARARRASCGSRRCTCTRRRRGARCSASGSAAPTSARCGPASAWPARRCRPRAAAGARGARRGDDGQARRPRAVVAPLRRRRPRAGARPARPRRRRRPRGAQLGTLSSGEQQRVLLARTLMTAPGAAACSTSRPPGSTSAAARSSSRALGDAGRRPGRAADRPRHPPRRRDPTGLHPRAAPARRASRRVAARSTRSLTARRSRECFDLPLAPRGARRPVERPLHRGCGDAGSRPAVSEAGEQARPAARSRRPAAARAPAPTARRRSGGA